MLQVGAGGSAPGETAPARCTRPWRLLGGLAPSSVCGGCNHSSCAFRSKADQPSSTASTPSTQLANTNHPPTHPTSQPNPTPTRQVAAFADGRSAVNEYDCLLLEFVLGQRPDDAHVSRRPAAPLAPRPLPPLAHSAAHQSAPPVLRPFLATLASGAEAMHQCTVERPAAAPAPRASSAPVSQPTKFLAFSSRGQVHRTCFSLLSPPSLAHPRPTPRPLPTVRPPPQKVKAFLLETIASDPGLQQTELVFLGLFGRACRVLETANAQVGGATAETGRPDRRWRGGGRPAPPICPRGPARRVEPSPWRLPLLPRCAALPACRAHLAVGPSRPLLPCASLPLAPGPPPPPLPRTRPALGRRRWRRRGVSVPRWWSCWTCGRAGWRPRWRAASRSCAPRCGRARPACRRRCRR